MKFSKRQRSIPHIFCTGDGGGGEGGGCDGGHVAPHEGGDCARAVLPTAGTHGTQNAQQQAILLILEHLVCVKEKICLRRHIRTETALALSCQQLDLMVGLSVLVSDTPREDLPRCLVCGAT